MATKFLEPGGDSDFLVGTTNGFWTSVIGGSPSVVTDFVHGNHVKSLKFAGGAAYDSIQKVGVIADSGTRISFYLYINALPTTTQPILIGYNASSQRVWVIKLDHNGVIKLYGNSLQIGTNGATLSTGVWYRISLALTITSTTVNRFELFVDAISSISITNATLTYTSSSKITLGNFNGDTTLDIRTSDHYIDDSNSLTDTGDMWVTAKRPVSNGTTNGFTGSGTNSGYGTGNSIYVNERPLATGGLVSKAGAGSAVTEEYNIEAKNVGDIDISTATIVDWLGWVSASSLVGETGNVIIDGSSVAQAITSTATLYTKIKGSATYPAGTGTDIGFITTTALTTVSLYECGVIVAYIPAVASSTKNFALLGVG